MVDAGGSDAFWPNGYKWALNTARMLADHEVHWFEEALHPDALEGALARDLDGAFERLVLEYQDRLYSFAMRLSGNPADAEEIAQDAFVRASRAVTAYPPERLAFILADAPVLVDVLHEKFDAQAKQLVTAYEPENAQMFVDEERLSHLGLPSSRMAAAAPTSRLSSPTFLRAIARPSSCATWRGFAWKKSPASSGNHSEPSSPTSIAPSTRCARRCPHPVAPSRVQR
jgi:hypothetical protein